MRHGQFMKVTSQEKVGEKMIDVLSFSVCRCGERFSTDHQLNAHILHPIASQPSPRPIRELGVPMQSAPALLVPAAKLDPL